VAQHRHHGVQLDHLVAQRPADDVLPVGLGLHPGRRLEADLRLRQDRRAQGHQLTLEGQVAAGVPVLALQFVVQVGGPDARADREPALNMGQLGGAEGVSG
jgi:hypothetical protein